MQLLLQLYNNTRTLEEALQILRDSDYDVEAAQQVMKQKNLRWALFKRPLSTFL
jgi:hypothetical protein